MQRMGAGGKDLGQQSVWIQREGRQQAAKFFGIELLNAWSVGIGIQITVLANRWASQGQQETNKQGRPHAP
ncbi:MAG: hypothetical protein AMXMBFR7_43450 [Planctomycetota bacterium]